MQKNAAQQLLTSIHQNKFNLKVLPLYRYALIKRSQNEYLFTSVWHHIVGDGAFLVILLGIFRGLITLSSQIK
ncbi:Condensation domain [Legionella cincinnatiensis]|uniref:Condensation domain n=1 Tax=Legionella cincinnatiensis TaxID=28085 RepID=A0A378IU50_9GAMM|nr:Condensation domain protein [Legionella cincinnatiensis]STX35534.1 Condensation domain [Legionella cincinnatiensis]